MAKYNLFEHFICIPILTCYVSFFVHVIWAIVGDEAYFCEPNLQDTSALLIITLLGIGSF